MKYEYDIIIIGGGPAGLVASKLAAGLGKKVALIEKERIGGDCTLTGCVPTKTLIASANYVHYAQEMARFACKIDTSCLDTAKVMEHVHDIVEEIYAGHTPEILEEIGIKIIIGTASFIDKHTLDVNGTTLKAKTFLIVSGARPFIPPIEGLDQIPYLTSKNFFSEKSLPKSLIILGGGPIGTEFAGCLPKLGTEVTMIERNKTILPREDAEIIPLVEQTLRESGVNLQTGLTAVKAVRTDTGVALECVDANNNTVTLSAEKLLIAVGRSPNIEELALDNAGIEYTRRGITVNNKLQTTAKNIYAAGDVVGPYMFSHMAEYQAAIATRNALIPFFKKKVDYNNAVWVTFTDPELAACGLTEAEARKIHGDTIQIYRTYFKNYDRPRTDSRRTGMAKFICDKRGYLIGAHIYGARAGDLIGEIQLGKYYNHKLKDFYPVIHPYPTYTDVIWQASKKAYIDSLRNNWFLKIISKLFGKKK